ncbi:MAG: hypothetical protein ACO32Z_08095, partial [Gemmatimonadaceae bacterium]
MRSTPVLRLLLAGGLLAPALPTPLSAQDQPRRPAPATATDPAPSASPTIRVVRDSLGHRLEVDGRSLMINGVNWDYIPIGENYAYNLWTQPDAFIVEALDREMRLVQRMGANAIRVYAGIPPRWIKHIYERYGIFTMVNHALGRYGVTIDGLYRPQTDYSDPRVRRLITE